MKNIIFFVYSVSLFVAGTIQAQKTNQFFDNSNESLHFLGVDITHIKLYGDFGGGGPQKIKSSLADINLLMEKEVKKYDLAGSFYHPAVSYNMGVTNKLNQQMNTAHIMAESQSDVSHLSQDDIKKIISKYDLSKIGKGAGLVIILEGLNKLKPTLSAYVCLVDLSTKKSFVIERMEEECGGFGLRNYTASAIEKMLKKIKTQKYNSWR